MGCWMRQGNRGEGVNNEITITKDEAALVFALLGMWEAHTTREITDRDAAALFARRLKRPVTST